MTITEKKRYAQSGPDRSGTFYDLSIVQLLSGPNGPIPDVCSRSRRLVQFVGSGFGVNFRRPYESPRTIIKMLFVYKNKLIGKIIIVNSKVIYLNIFYYF